MAETTEPFLILIVDDEIPIVETLAEFVTELGYTALVAYNGQQALALARERWPALVITDLMMPIMNGPDLIYALRVEAAARRKTPPRTVLVSAARTSQLTEIDADVILSKPFDLDQLEFIITRLLGPPAN